MSTLFAPNYTLSAPSSSSPVSVEGPPTPADFPPDSPPPGFQHDTSPYSSRPSSPSFASDEDSIAAFAGAPSRKSGYFSPAVMRAEGYEQMVQPGSSRQGRPQKAGTSSPSSAKAGRRPPPIQINLARRSTFFFPPSPTEDDVSPKAPPPSFDHSRSAGPSTAGLVSQFPDPPSWTPPLSPMGDTQPCVNSRRRDSLPFLNSRKASLVDGQLFSAPFAQADSASVAPISPAAAYAASGALESAPPTPRRMSIAGSGTRRRSSAGLGHSGATGYISFASCINGALAHHKKAGTYEDFVDGPSPKALHHFNRANELLNLALQMEPSSPEASIYKASVSLALARRFLSPPDALLKAQAALNELRLALGMNKSPLPRNLYVAGQVQLASLTSLLATLSEGLHLSMVPRAIWQGEVGDLARESVTLWEEVVGCENAVIKDGYVAAAPSAEGSPGASDEDESEDRINLRFAERERRSSSICHRRITEETLVESYLSLSEAAQFAAVLAPDLINTDRYFDLAEGALGDAYQLAKGLRTALLGPPPARRMSASTMSPPAVTNASPLMYQVYLRAGPLKMERLRHTIEVGSQLPLNQVLARSVIADMGKVAGDLAYVARGRTPLASGSTASDPFITRRDAKPLAVQALTQLGDAEHLLAHLLKRIWRRRGSHKGGNLRRTASHESMPALGQSSARPSDAELVPSAPDSRRASIEERRRTSSIARRESFVDKHTIVEEESGEDGEEDKKPQRRSVSSEQDNCGITTPQWSSPQSAPLSRAMLTQALENRRSSLTSPSGLRKSSSSASLANTLMAAPVAHRPSWMSQASDSTVQAAPSPRMSMAQFRRCSAAGSMRSVQSDEDILASGSVPAAPMLERRNSSALMLVLKRATAASAEDTSLSSPLSTEALAEQAWNLLSSAMRNYKDAFSLLKPARSGAEGSIMAPSASTLAHQRATILLAVSMSAYFRASLAPRIPAAKESRSSLLVSAEVYSTWAAREVGWEWLVEDQPQPDDFSMPFASDRPLIVSKHAAVGQRAIFTLLRTVWHRAVTGGPGEISRDEKRAAKTRVEAVVLRLKNEAGCGAYDITRFKVGTEKLQGEFDQSESLFWAGLSRTLKG